MRVRPLAAAGGALLLTTAVGAAPAAASSTGEASVTVVHGVALPAAQVVDVWAGDTVLIDDLEYQDFQTISVPGGTYDLYVTPADAEDTSGALISATGVEVPAGADVSAVANQVGGTPNLATFVNEPVPDDAAGLTVRHTADAPAVDVLADGESLFMLEPGEGMSTEVPGGTYDVSVTAGGEPVPGLSVDGLTLEEGTGYYAYAVGDGDNGYALVLTTDEGTPSGVPAGGDGSAGTSVPVVPLLLVAAGAGVLAISARKFATR